MIALGPFCSSGPFFEVLITATQRQLIVRKAKVSESFFTSASKFLPFFHFFFIYFSLVFFEIIIQDYPKIFVSLKEELEKVLPGTTDDLQPRKLSVFSSLPSSIFG